MSVGRVLGTQDAMPLEFWVAIEQGEYLELDDVVVVRTELPDGQVVTLHGVVDLVKARHEGVLFDSDVFLVEDAVLPAGTSRTAHVSVTRLEPEIYVPPLPGRPVERAVGADRERALFFDGMVRRFPLGLGRDGQVIYGNLEFLDGTRGAHVNISGISGIATKTTYAMFLLHSVFRSGRAWGRGRERARPRLQRQGRRPPVPRPAQRRPEAGGRGPLRRSSACPPPRFSPCSCWPRCGAAPTWPFPTPAAARPA